jgi:hypothetical protein
MKNTVFGISEYHFYPSCKGLHLLLILKNVQDSIYTIENKAGGVLGIDIRNYSCELTTDIHILYRI